MTLLDAKDEVSGRSDDFRGYSRRGIDKLLNLLIITAI